MAEISMLDVAFEQLSKSKDPLSFGDLFIAVAKALNMTDEEKKARMGRFYTDLSIDGRFVAFTDNTWDLRSRHTYDKVHIDVNDVYSEVDEESDKDDDDDDDESTPKTDEEGTETEEEVKHDDADDIAAELGIKKTNDDI